MSEEEQELVKLLTMLLFVYAQHMPNDVDGLMKAHGVTNSTRNLIDALQTGRVRLIKSDGWKE